MGPVESQDEFNVGPVGNYLADTLAAAIAQGKSLDSANEEAQYELVDLAAHHGALAVGQVYPGSPRLMQPQPQKKPFKESAASDKKRYQHLRPTLPSLESHPPRPVARSW